MSDMFFNTEQFDEDINKLIVSLGRMTAEITDKEIEAARDAAKIIADEQKRLIGGKYPNLAGHITYAAFKGKKNSEVKAFAGYTSKTIEEHPEAYVIEFGRPGQSTRRSQRQEYEPRRKKDGTLYFQNKGDFKPYSHIRAAWFNKKDAAARHFIERLLTIVKKEWDNE